MQIESNYFKQAMYQEFQTKVQNPLLTLKNYRFYVVFSNKFKVYRNTVTFISVVDFLKQKKANSHNMMS